MTALEEIRPGDPAHDRMVHWLTDARLAVTDLDEGGPVFLVSPSGESPVAFAGLTGDGQDRLLRSVVVDPARRSEGLGRSFLDAVEAFALRSGAERLWLLTDSASPFFRAAGYVERDRADVPALVRASSQFQGLCSSSSVLMCKTLR